jgi:hypothetical protein
VTAKQPRPILLNSCAKAATASEARFRINAPRFTTRASRIVAVDEGAAGIVRRAANELWTGDAHFLVFGAPMSVDGLDGPHVDATLRTVNGAEAVLSDELTDADVVVMVATTNAGADAVSVIGQACFARAVMTAGLVVAEGGAAERAVASLRPHAMVLVVTEDEEDVPEMLRALRV